MATLEQIGIALKNADKVGDVESARKLALAYKSKRDSQQAQQPVTQPESNDTLGHKAGVASRGVIEGIAGLPGDIYNVSQAIPGMVMDYAASKGFKQSTPQPPRTIDTEQFGSKIADLAGLPKAAPDDSIIYPVSKTVGGFVIPATNAAKFGKEGSAINKLGVLLGGDNPITNIAGIVAGQTASDMAKKSGQSEGVQLGANILGNMAAGGVMGIAKAAGRVAGRTGKAAIGAGLEGVAGRMLHRAAGDESAIVQAALESGKVPTIVRTIKAYQPTTSEIAGNAGISTLLRQTGLDQDAATALANRTFSNVKSVSDYASKAAGSPERKALMQTKGWQDVEDITKPMRERNLPVDLTNVRATLDAAIEHHTGNKAITKALEKVKKDLPGDDTANFNELYNFKQGLDEALRANPMTDPKLASLQRAKTALNDTKKAIASAMTVTEPQFNDYLKAQAKNISAMSQRTAAEEALNKAKMTIPLVSNASGTQEEVFALSNNKLTALVRDKKKMAALSPAQRRIIETAQKHAALASRKGAGSMVGSSTAQNLSVQNAVSNDLMAAAFGEKGNALSRAVSPILNIAGKAANPVLSKFGSDNAKALSAIIAKAELEPAYAAKLMKQYGLGHMNFNDSAGRAALRGAISQYMSKQ